MCKTLSFLSNVLKFSVHLDYTVILFIVIKTCKNSSQSCHNHQLFHHFLAVALVFWHFSCHCFNSLAYSWIRCWRIHPFLAVQKHLNSRLIFGSVWGCSSLIFGSIWGCLPYYFLGSFGAVFITNFWVRSGLFS